LIGSPFDRNSAARRFCSQASAAGPNRNAIARHKTRRYAIFLSILLTSRIILLMITLWGEGVKSEFLLTTESVDYPGVHYAPASGDFRSTD